MLQPHCWPLLLRFMKTYGPKEHLMWLPPPCLSSTISLALIPALIYSTPQNKWCLALSLGVLPLMPPMTRNMQWYNFSPETVTDSSSTRKRTIHFWASFIVAHKSILPSQCASLFFFNVIHVFIRETVLRNTLGCFLAERCAVLKKVCIHRKRLLSFLIHV